MPSIVSDTVEYPCSATCTDFCAFSETPRDFFEDNSAVCLICSTVAVVSVTDAAVSDIPAAIWVVDVRISLADDARTLTPSQTSSLIRRKLSSMLAKAFLRMSLSETGVTTTVRSPSRDLFGHGRHLLEIPGHIGEGVSQHIPVRNGPDRHRQVTSGDLTGYGGHLLQVPDHRRERLGQAPHLVLPVVAPDRHLEIPRGDPLGRSRDLPQRVGDDSAQIEAIPTEDEDEDADADKGP